MLVNARSTSAGQVESSPYGPNLQVIPQLQQVTGKIFQSKGLASTKSLSRAKKRGLSGEVITLQMEGWVVDFAADSRNGNAYHGCGLCGAGAELDDERRAVQPCLRHAIPHGMHSRRWKRRAIFGRP